MLKISTKTRYALRALLEMAYNKKQKLFRLEELSQHQNISRKYLENIFTLLRKEGIIRSRVGKNGGFYLAEKIEKISVLRILEAMEGEVMVVRCHDHGHVCARLSFCPGNIIWNEVNASIRKVLASKNLRNLSHEEAVRIKCDLSASRAFGKISPRHRR
jgi:Rrf2 family protein